MAARSSPAVAPADATSLQSATRSRISPNQNNGAESLSQQFPSSNRLLRSTDFRAVYDNGTRIVGPLFAAFCLCRPEATAPRVGFTVPRALGNAVVRNRLKRRFREAVRFRLGTLASPWFIVINPRRAAIECPFSGLEKEIARLFDRCSKQDCNRP